jgi:hypothetical protein
VKRSASLPFQTPATMMWRSPVSLPQSSFNGICTIAAWDFGADPGSANISVASKAHSAAAASIIASGRRSAARVTPRAATSIANAGRRVRRAMPPAARVALTDPTAPVSYSAISAMIRSSRSSGGGGIRRERTSTARATASGGPPSSPWPRPFAGNRPRAASSDCPMRRGERFTAALRPDQNRSPASIKARIAATSCPHDEPKHRVSSCSTCSRQESSARVSSATPARCIGRRRAVQNQLPSSPDWVITNRGSRSSKRCGALRCRRGGCCLSAATIAFCGGR